MKTTAKTPPKHDDGLEWLRDIRRQLAAECNHDPFEMGRRLREREKAYHGRIFKTKRILVPADDATEAEPLLREVRNQ